MRGISEKGKCILVVSLGLIIGWISLRATQRQEPVLKNLSEHPPLFVQDLRNSLRAPLQKTLTPDGSGRISAPSRESQFNAEALAELSRCSQDKAISELRTMEDLKSRFFDPSSSKITTLPMNEIYHLILSTGERRRIRIIHDNESGEGPARLQLQWYSESSQGFPLPLALPSSLDGMKPEDKIKALLSEGNPIHHEKEYTMMTESGDSAEVIEQNGKTVQLHIRSQHSDFGCTQDSASKTLRCKCISG